MAQEDPLARISLEDLTVDEEGRVIITNPELAEQLRAAAQPRAKPAPNNCPSNNVAGGCPINTGSCPTNTNCPTPKALP
jgi:hypothetical protein